jgi:Ca2+-binding EF-hand superfamily protein
MSTSQFAGMGATGQTPRAPKDFGQLDSDGDGSVSAKEYGLDSADKMDQQLFAGIDQDSDGSLSRSEISSFESKMAAHGDHGKKDDPIASLDSNSDGSVSGDEFGLGTASDQVKALFKAIDSDSDGSLSSTELSSFKDSMQSQMGGAQGAGRPHGPPPGPPPGEAGSNGSASSSGTSSSSVDKAAKTDVSALLQRLAEQYFSQLGSAAQPALSLTA